MGHQIVKQPDGRLAIFSDGVNDWLRWDMTPHEVVEYYAERAAQSARESASRTVHYVMTDNPRKAYYQFTRTFAELNAVAKHGGSTDGPEGPVDEKTMLDLDNMVREFEMGTDGHLVHGAGEHG